MFISWGDMLGLRNYSIFPVIFHIFLSFFPILFADTHLLKNTGIVMEQGIYSLCIVYLDELWMKNVFYVGVITYCTT